MWERGTNYNGETEYQWNGFTIYRSKETGKWRIRGPRGFYGERRTLKAAKEVAERFAPLIGN